jgi:hypothetical protein
MCWHVQFGGASEKSNFLSHFKDTRLVSLARSKGKGLLHKFSAHVGCTWIDLFASTNGCQYIRQPMAESCMLCVSTRQGDREEQIGILVI